jgi:PAS domain S-box-containing protein
VTEPAEIDYRAVYRTLPAGIALLTTRLVYADVNEAYLSLSGRRREELVGRYVFDVFPDNPTDPHSTGMRRLRASLHRVLVSGEAESMALQRYDVERPDRPGVYDERYWSTINTPILTPDGEVALISHRVEEVTAFIKAHARAAAQGGDSGLRELEAELFTRARELQRLNERLRQAYARERDVALTLQAAMLPGPRPMGYRVAVRYQPAAGALNVCGDWYDLTELADGRLGVAVGDVVGHGLEAACVMGQLRSALSAAIRTTEEPALALDALGLYARSLEGAESTTVVKACIDWAEHTITYSSAGHPPAALLHPDGNVDFLDEATDPPLGARPEHVPRPQAAVTFTSGTALVLYTDGLIERRGEDIDAGLARLAASLARHHDADPEAMADALLTELIPATGATDDTALVIIRL